eukprot:UN02835
MNEKFSYSFPDDNMKSLSSKSPIKIRCKDDGFLDIISKIKKNTICQRMFALVSKDVSKKLKTKFLEKIIAHPTNDFLPENCFFDCQSQ